MNLPFVLDIALGLIFIYLVLSLLASEIQEIIGTVLQWRAEHLKRSIEVLLSGNDRNSEKSAQALADILYDAPLIRSLNQEAKGGIARSFRGVCHAVGQGYRLLSGARNVFGKAQTSGPSYIPSEAFATTLVEQMELGRLWQLLAEDRIGQYVESKILLPVNDTLNDLKASTGNEFLLNGELRQLEQAIAQILQDFHGGRVRLAETLDRLITRLDEFSVVAQEVLPDSHHLTDMFLRRLDYIRRGVASSELERKALLETLRPSIESLLAVFDDGSVTYQELVSLAQGNNPQAAQLLKTIQQNPITPALKSSLVAIARKVEGRVHAAEDVAATFGQEVEQWFDRGMERATGVYKRNAKAVAILIGTALAIFLNVDSFHIADRLARDPAVRNTISQAAEQFASNPSYTGASGSLQAELEAVQAAVDEAFSELSFPLGYTNTVMAQQRDAEKNWPVPYLRRILGWLVSGVAIAMGANFWFDLLKKVINVRGSGVKIDSK
ncbi:hypothetical protein C7271_05595 [filamentous cyanobacterium CCP5]|nr:hypothetical protein C7271_05595 [filamentous cyanobacterium CCP5]